MNLQIATQIAAAVGGFFISFIAFSVLNQKQENSLLKLSPFPIIFFTFLLAASGCYIFIGHQLDFVFGYTLPEFASVFVASALIYALGRYLPAQRLLQHLAIAAGAIVCAYLLPSEFVFYEPIPPFLTPLIIALLWYLFSICYQYLNGLDGVISINTIAVSAGIFVLSLTGLAPVLLGTFGLVLAMIILAFLPFNWYPARLHFSPSDCTALGFLVGGLAFQTTTEECGPCIVIFCMFLIVEVFFAVIKRLTLRAQYQDITANTFYYQANLSGFSPTNINNNLIRLCIVLVVLGAFEAYAPNSYSLPILCFIITLWYLNKIKNWQTPDKTLREINQDVVNNLKSNFISIKDNISKDNEQK